MELRYKKLAGLAPFVYATLGLSQLALASAGGHSSSVEFPKALSSYHDAGMGLLETLSHRISADPFNLAALVIFLLAIIHTFLPHRLRLYHITLSTIFKAKNPEL